MKTRTHIFFDIGYTLVNEDGAWSKRCSEQCQTEQAVALGITPDMLLKEIELASIRFESPFKSVIKKYGFTYSAPYRSEFETLYSDTAPVLEELSKRFCLGIIANQSGDLLARLKQWDIDKYFNTVVSSADYDFAKPDKRLFSVALEKSGCAAGNAIMVGDRLDNDTLPANELGFQTVRVRRGFAKYQVAPSINYEPTYEVNNLSELLRLQFILN